MMNIAGLSHNFMWENLHNLCPTTFFFFLPHCMFKPVSGKTMLIFKLT